MSETKHTKGPWIYRCHARQGGSNDTFQKHQVVHYQNETQDEFICREVSSKANALLIAAAPDLLAACRVVRDYHRENDSGSGELFGLDFVTTCIAAIAEV